MQKILMMAGGTGGHVIPALSVAKAFQEKGIEVHWLGCQQGLESKLVPAAHIPIHYIHRVPVRGKSIKEIITVPGKLFRALWEAYSVIRRINPDLVMGMGGFASFPGGVVARLCRKPLVLHEQNAVAGLANRCLAKIAALKFQAFPHAFKHGMTVGNPVRTSISTLPAPLQRFSNRQGPLRLLVMGGSQGAAAINEFITKAVALLPSDLRPEIWHIAGSGKADLVESNYKKVGVSAKVEEYIDDPSKAYEWADLVLSRSGALTVSELAAAGIGSLLIPFPHSQDDHQTLNAKWLADAGAAILIPQSELNPDKLIELLKKFSVHREALQNMATLARSKAQINATEIIVNQCLEKFP